jgi:glycogen synthase
VTSAPRRILVASLTAIRRDGRILRQVDALLAAGHHVIAVGAAGGPSHPAEATGRLRWVDVAVPGWSRAGQAKAAAGFLIGGVSGISALVATYPGIAALRRAILDFTTQHGAPDFAFANDWHSLPAILALHQRFGTPFHYDTHEHALSEHSHNPLWRLAFPRLIERIERAGIKAAHSVSSPSDGICRDLVMRYGPLQRIATIRNITDMEALPPRPLGRPVRVLYHGLFKEDRALLPLVRSIADWPAHYALDLRGHATNPAYGAALEAAAAASAGRVTLYPMATPEALTAQTNTADIGVFLPDVSAPQLRYALPNKLFEYLSGGLMLIVSANSDMADFVTETGSGIAIEPQVLARTLGELSDDTITRYKLAAHTAAQSLSWAAEAQKLRALTGL